MVDYNIQVLNKLCIMGIQLLCFDLVKNATKIFTTLLIAKVIK